MYSLYIIKYVYIYYLIIQMSMVCVGINMLLQKNRFLYVLRYPQSGPYKSAIEETRREHMLDEMGPSSLGITYFVLRE